MSQGVPFGPPRGFARRKRGPEFRATASFTRLRTGKIRNGRKRLRQCQ